MMICSICGWRVSFDPDRRSYECGGCGRIDPAIQVRPYLPGKHIDLFSVPENIMFRRRNADSEINLKHEDRDYDMPEDIQELLIDKKRGPPKRDNNIMLKW